VYCIKLEGKGDRDMNIERSYPFIDFVAGLYKFLAFLSAVGGALMAFNGRGGEVFTGIVGGSVGCITFLAFGELLKLQVHVEGNTRRIANLLDKENHQSKPLLESDYRPGFEPKKSPYQENEESTVK